MIKLLKNDKYLLLVDTEDKIEQDDWITDDEEITEANDEWTGEEEENYGWSKIIAASPKLGDLPLLPELPKQEEDVNKLAEKHEEFLKKTAGFDKETAYKCALSYGIGYKDSKAASKKYSGEDMRRCYEGVLQNVGTCIKKEELPSFKEYIQSLSPTLTPIGFVLSDKFTTFEENLKHGRYIFK